MRRWTDGKSWSASRVSGSFLTYREMEGKRGGSGFAPVAARAGRTPDSTRGSDEDTEMAGEEGPDGYRYKPDGLMKQSFSITTSQGAHLHLISYYARSHPTAQTLNQPSTDPNLRHIRPAKGMYPESTVHEQPTVSAVTRGPMGGAPFAISPHMAAYPRTGATHPQSYGPPGFPYPPSPLSTPPNHYTHLQFAHPIPMQPMGGALPPINANIAAYLPYGQPHLPPVSQPLQSAHHDRPPQARPPPPESSLPPPPPHHYATANGVPHRISPQPASATLPPLHSTQKSESAPPIDPRLTTSLPLPNRSPKANGETLSVPPKVPSPLRELPPESKPANGSTASSYPSVASLINGATPSETRPENATGDTDRDNVARSSPGTVVGDGPTIKLAPAPKDIPAQKVDNKNGDYNALRKLDSHFHNNNQKV
jgi:hypothetical protein